MGLTLWEAGSEVFGGKLAAGVVRAAARVAGCQKHVYACVAARDRHQFTVHRNLPVLPQATTEVPKPKNPAISRALYACPRIQARGT